MARRAAKGTKRKKPVELMSSSDVLIDSTGEIYTKVLENLLCDACAKGLKDSDHVVIVQDKRISDVPEYENVKLARSVRWLRRQYVEIYSMPYVFEKKNIEEKYRPQPRGFW